MGDFSEDYFIDRVQQFYMDVDRDFRAHGAETLGFQDTYFRLSRVATPVVDFIEIKKILFEIDNPQDESGGMMQHRRWPFAWNRAAEKFAALAGKAEKSGHTYTAGQNYLRAALLAHSGQLFSRPIWSEKAELQQKRTVWFRKSMELLGMKRLTIQHQNYEIPAYLWLPDGVQNPPLVIMAPGANSVKEELYRWSRALVARGMATLTFDGPGQGELSLLNGGRNPLRMDTYHQVISSIIDYCHGHLSEMVDIKRVALWGQATGGHLVSRVYAHDKRMRLIVNLDGPPTLESYPFMPGDILEEQRDVLGFESFSETWQYLKENGNALREARSVEIPYLLIHGGRNPLFGKAAVDALLSAIGPTAAYWQYDDGNLGVFNHDLEMTDRMADWIADHL